MTSKITLKEAQDLNYEVPLNTIITNNSQQNPTPSFLQPASKRHKLDSLGNRETKRSGRELAESINDANVNNKKRKISKGKQSKQPSKLPLSCLLSRMSPINTPKGVKFGMFKLSLHIVFVCLLAHCFPFVFATFVLFDC